MSLMSGHTYEAAVRRRAPTLLGGVAAACWGCGSFFCFIC